VDFVLPVAATNLLGAWAGKLDSRRFHQAFGRYVSPDVAAQVLAHAQSLEGERREVSILFSDLRGFTTISETMAPDRVASHLTEYFDAMTAAIFRHRGMVNDFIGDAVMAVFGAPLGDPDHALHAVRAAADMDRALAGLNARWSATGAPTLKMGIGVHSGEVFAGNVGGKARMKYTIVGDPVNVASRVEGLNKETGTTILITEATRSLVADRVDARDCGAIPVKGRNEPVRVYELLAVRPEGAAQKGESA
jgi:adenylate cyclase